MQPTTNRRTRRLRGTATAAVLTAAALVLTGCSTASNAQDADASAEPHAGGTLTFGLSSDTSVIDPSITGSGVTALIDRDVVDSLVGQASDNSFTPWLASKWSVNDDNTEYTFTIRKGVTFSDGTTLDAAAVKTNFDRILDPDTASSYAKSLLGPVAAITADGDTLTIRYDEPFAPLLQGLSLPYLGIQSPKYLASTKDTTNTVVGSGPFTLKSFTPGSGTVLEKRKDYDWGPGYAKHHGAAYLDEIRYRVLPESSARLGALTSGQVQAIDAVPPASAKTVTGTSGLDLTSYENSGVNEAYFLNTSKGPFEDESVRRAFQSAIDTTSAVKAAYFGVLNPAKGILGPKTKYYDKDAEKRWGYDTGRAEQLLDDAGWSKENADGIRVKDGKSLTVKWVYDTTSTSDTDVTLAQAVQAQVKKVGIDLELAPTDAGGYTTATTDNDYDLVSFFYVRAEPDILRTVFDSQYAPPNGADVSRVSSLDDRLEEAVGASDPKREELYASVQQEILDKAYAVPLYVPAYQFGQSTKLKGVTWATNSKPLFYDAWLAE